MKGKFKPTLTTIEEEYCIPDEVIHKIAGIFPHVANENIQQYGERIKKWDSATHRQQLLGPHSYPRKHSRNDPSIRYSYDRSSSGLWEFISQQREILPYKTSNTDDIKEKLTQKHVIFQQNVKIISEENAIIKRSYKNPVHKIWEKWESPKHVMSIDEIEKRYGSREKIWDSIQHKNMLFEKARQPMHYPFKHAKNDCSRRLSYENSSEGLRNFIKTRRFISNNS
ncbi:conserved hypothetical protein [Escherichia coli TA280]|nr:conserved hypothetical protein [Escherichia coli TA280]